MLPLKKLAIVISLLVSSSALAQHAAHEHGLADLRIAVDGRTLLIEFESPLANLVGFEHRPGTDAERETMAAAQKRLRDHESLFVTPAAAACAIQEVELEAPWFEADGHHAHHDDKHHEHKRAAHGHAEHGENHGKYSRDGGDDHADAYAVYAYECANPEALDGVDVAVIERFPAVKVLRTETAGPRGQAAVRIESPRMRVAL